MSERVIPAARLITCRGTTQASWDSLRSASRHRGRRTQRFHHSALVLDGHDSVRLVEGRVASKTGGIELSWSSVVPFPIQRTSRIVPICQLRPSLDTFTSPIKHDGTQTRRDNRTECLWATRRGSVRRGRPPDQSVQAVVPPLRSVVIALWWSEIAPAAPEEPGDQEHPEEHPHQPRGAEDDGSNHRANHQQRREPEHG